MSKKDRVAGAPGSSWFEDDVRVAFRQAPADSTCQEAGYRGFSDGAPALRWRFALANKTARIAWALVAKGDLYRPAVVPAA